jgi:hypothetical protein
VEGDEYGVFEERELYGGFMEMLKEDEGLSSGGHRCKSDEFREMAPNPELCSNYDFLGRRDVSAWIKFYFDAFPMHIVLGNRKK